MPGQKFVADLVIGIIIIVFAVCAFLAGIAVLGIGGLAATGGLTAGAGSDQATKEAAAAVTTAGGVAAIWGVLLMAASVGAIAGAIGMIKGAKWGFMLIIIIEVINVVSGFMVSGMTNIFNLAVPAALVIYCVLRLGGQLGPKPV
jgi:hypothetical protein